MSMKSWSVVGAMLGVGALVLGACTSSGGTFGRGAEIVSCTPGLQIEIGCGGMGLGSCEGDPILTICNGNAGAADSCVGSSATGFIAENDDGGDGRCSYLSVLCPASGSIAVRPRAFSGVPTCNWQTRVSGI